MKAFLIIASLLFLSSTPIKEYQAEVDPFFCSGCDGELTEYGGWCGLYCGIGMINVTSSNELTDSSGLNYNGRNAHDFNLSTSWAVEDGIGETITFTIENADRRSENKAINEISVFNGLYMNETLWEQNARIKSMLLKVDGTTIGKIRLLDERRRQTVLIDPIYCERQETVKIEFEIFEVYPGTNYRDVCLTELKFEGIGHH
ncbi:MAG: hypothetical protein ACI865_001094 [Flavobacteriaceae bacterium]|jgi:hypothetical protein